MSNIEWKCFIHPPHAMRINLLPKSETRDHPLKAVVVTERIPRTVLGSQPSTGRMTPISGIISSPSSILEPLSLAMEGLDPLTAFAIEEMDPLSKIAAEENASSSCASEKDKKDDFEPWSSRRATILSKYTTSEKISIITSFLSEGEKVVVKTQSTAVDKIQHRLEQLDNFEEDSQRKMNLSQAEYINRIDQLNRELVLAWNSEQRVKSLRIAIQCAKFLSDINVLCFYPSKFVLITDILDIFGQLIYNRLRTKADFIKPGSKTPTALPEDFTPDMVPDLAKETCLNWFYKIASIRELVPRLYVEMALLKSYSFLSSNEPTEAVMRLTQIINGIGNPLVAIYARCYLCRAGINISHLITDKSYLLNNFYEFLRSYHQIGGKSVSNELTAQKVTPTTYMTLFAPALDFILQVVASDASDGLLNELLQRSRSLSNSSLILNAIMAAFKPACITSRTLQFLEMIEECKEDKGIPTHVLLRTLGLCVGVSQPPPEHRRLVLNVVWKHIMTLTNPNDYISVAEVWAPFVIECFSYREMNTMLGDIILHLSSERSYESHYNSLKVIVDRIVNHVQDLEVLLAMDNFLPFVDLFQQESIHVEVCKKILTMCTHNHNRINDPVVVNALMYLCSVLHESVDALIPQDESRQIGDILCHIVKMIDYGRDFEQQLSFYVEARGLFSNLDPVFVQLVQCVNLLSVNTRRIVNGVHSRKSGDFARACSAYCFITIPSIKSVKTQLNLYVLSGQVALFNQCYGQADACFKAAFNVISELHNEKTPKFEQQFIEFSKKFLSVLLVVPDNPEFGVLHFVRTLLNILQTYEWESKQSLLLIHLCVIDFLAAMAQETYPYHIDKVESNDALYGSDPKFTAEVNKMCTVIVGEIVNYLKQSGISSKQGAIVMEFVMKIALRSDLSPQMSNLCLNLWNLAIKNEAVDRKSMIKTREYLKTRGMRLNNDSLLNLTEKMSF